MSPDSGENALSVQPAAEYSVADASALGASEISFRTLAELNDTNGANYTLKHENGTLTVTESVPTPVPPSIAADALPDGTVGESYSQTLAATGDAPVTWSVESGSLPGGLSLSPGGAVSGTPSAAGMFEFTVKASNGAGNDTAELAIAIAEADAPPVAPPDTPTRGEFGGGVSEYRQGSAEGLSHITQKDFALFGGAAVDGSPLARDVHYSAESGSTVVTLYPSYLETLPPGGHTLTVSFSDGVSVSGQFTITGESGDGGSGGNGDSGDGGNGGSGGSGGSTRGGGSLAYTVTFETNGGGDISPVSVPAGGKAARPKDPAKDGFVFVGWYSDRALTEAYSFDGAVRNSFALYAKWEETGQTGAESTAGIQPSAGAAKTASPFSDVTERDWFYGDVLYAHSNGLMSGTDAQAALFSPNAPVTRGMLAAVLGRHYGADTSRYASAGFSDVDPEQYYAPYVEWARQAGLVFGVGGGRFSPAAPVTRQDLAVILARYAAFAGLALPETRGYARFTDEADIADYAKEAIERFFRAAIVSGRPNGAFKPKAEATRAEAAAMLRRVAENAG